MSGTTGPRKHHHTRKASPESQHCTHDPMRTSNAEPRRKAGDQHPREEAFHERRHPSSQGDLGVEMLKRLGKQELCDIARRRDIEGYSQMSKDELARSVYDSFEE